MEFQIKDIGEIVTLVISVSALAISYLTHKRTIKLDHQATIVDLEVKRQELLLLATKINLAQIERNVDLKRIASFIDKLPSNVISNYKDVIDNMEELTVRKEILGPMESIQFSGSHDEQVQIRKNIGILTKTKELSDRYDLVVAELITILNELGFL